MWTPAYTPGDRKTSQVYSNNPVLHLYISCYVTVNKPVLSYLLLCLLPQWWPQHDPWSLWPRLRRASSQTVTRPSCQQCDNPTWSHTALLSRFHACCRSSFQLHNWHSGLLGGSPMESLQSHCIHKQSHWSNGSTLCFSSWGTRVQSTGKYFCETEILLLALSRYILHKSTT